MTMWALRCGATQARISRRGAELRSLRVGNDEYLWQDESGVWPHSAPILFPHVGRLRNGGYEHAGRWYAMGTHGFAAESEFLMLEQLEDSLTLALPANEATRAVYPFEFELRVHFKLRERQLVVRYEVDNKEAHQPLRFGLGSHPAFALGGDPHADWGVHFDQAEQPQVFRLSDANLLETKPEAIHLGPDGKTLRLSPDLFLRDALIFKGTRSRTVSLVHRKRGLRIRLHTEEAPHLGLWAKPGAAYVCIEPWFGIDEDASAPLAWDAKAQLVQLPAGSTFETGYRLELGLA